MQRAWILVALLTAPIGVLDASPSPSPAAPQRAAAAGTVEIPTKDGLKLKGSALAPKTPSQQAPAALLIHDSGGERKQMEDIADRLSKSGFFVLSLDLRGHGESRSDQLDWERLGESERQGLWAFAPRDLEAGAEWLRQQPGVHRTNLVLVGFGSGCSLAVRHASRDENVRGLALIDPRPQEFGFDVASDILEIEGTPTYIVATKDARPAAERMVAEANAVTAPNEYVQIDFVSPKCVNALEDKKASATMVKWLKNLAFPSKGKS
jgi:dienelactone hydrolase